LKLIEHTLDKSNSPKNKMLDNPNQPNNPNETVFIPCEICDEPVALENYTEHTTFCNSARFVEFHGVSLDYLLNPAQSLNHVSQVAHEINFANNLASEDEREEHNEPEHPDEDEGPIAGEPQPNVHVVPMASLIGALIGGVIDPDEIMAQQAQEPPAIDNLMNLLQNFMTANILNQQQAGNLGGLGNLEDVVVGLTPEQRMYCLTTKTTTDPQTCNICCDDVNEMTTLICGHELCSSCATRQFTANVKCPFCNQDLRDIINPT
jgi:hypothetical protein